MPKNSSRRTEDQLATFDDAMKATYESMYADTKMIREKRKAMKTQGMGHK